MVTTVTKRGRTVIPAVIRRRYKITEGNQLEWIDNGQTITAAPVPSDPITALRGSIKGKGLMEILLIERKKGARHEQ